MMNNDLPAISNLHRDMPVGLPGGASEFFATVQETSLLDYWRMVVKRSHLIAYTALIVFSLVTIATLKMTRKYEAVGRIMVSRGSGDVVADQITQQAGGATGAGGDLSTEIETQANIIQSDSLALAVIQQLHLYQEPAFAGDLAKQNYDGGLSPLGAPPEMDPQLQETMLKIFRKNLTVVEVPNTRLIEIHFLSPDSKLAAAIAQQIATTLQDRGTQSRYESTTHATEWLSNELNDLKHQVEQSEQSLVDYQKNAGIVGLDDKQNTIMTKLDDLNHALTLVQNDRAAKEANYESVQSGKPELSAAVPGTSQIFKLRQQESDLKGQYAQSMAQFGEQYPKVVAIANQLKELRAAIDEENQRISQELKSDYQISKSREQSLQQIFDQQKQSAIELSERSVEYKILEHDANSYRELYESLTKTLKQAEVLASLQSSNISVIDTPIVPNHPSKPDIPRNLAIGLVLGLAFGLATAFTAEMVDNRVYRPEDVPMIAKLPVLASIPYFNPELQEKPQNSDSDATLSSSNVGLISWLRPRSEWAEAYRALRTSLLLSSSDVSPKVMVVTSGLPQEGKSTTSFNIATVLAQSGNRVLLIDADLRRPSVHKLLKATPQYGLSTVLAGATPYADVIFKTEIAGLEVLPAGPLPPNPAELLGANAMKFLLDECRKQYDFIIIDAPPVLSVTDAVVLSTKVDAVLLVMRAGVSTKHCLRRTRELLASVGARVPGIIVNALSVTFADGYYYYGYSKYSSYYKSDEGSGPDDGSEQGSGRSATA